MKNILRLVLAWFDVILSSLIDFTVKLFGVLLPFAFGVSVGISIYYLIEWILGLFSVSQGVLFIILRIVLTITSTAVACYYLVSEEFIDDKYFSPDLCIAVWITSTILIWRYLQ